MNKKVVLSLEWTSYPSRDTETATLVRNYLRLHGIKVISGSVHNAYALLRKHRPDLVYMTNIIGAHINFRIACYCRSKNIKLVTGISEGDIKEHKASGMVWGHNSLRSPVESEILLWSDFQREKFIDQHSFYSAIAHVTGSPGADRYKFCAPSEALVDRSGYKIVVGLGCFNFPEDSSSASDASKDIKDTRSRLSEDRHAFAETLDDLVSMMPEVLFLFKLHPGGLRGKYGAGIEKAARRRNVKVLPKDASILNCIAASDVWMSYESNSAMEAWLMNKHTGLLNPSGTDFERSDFYKGQPNFATAVEWRDALHCFLQAAELPGFKELESERKKVIKKVIGWDDGFNHVRSGNAILKALDSDQVMAQALIPPHLNPSPKEYITQSLKFFATQRNLVKSGRRKWCEEELAEFEAVRMDEQIRFYENLGDDWFDRLQHM